MRILNVSNELLAERVIKEIKITHSMRYKRHFYKRQIEQLVENPEKNKRHI